MVTSVGKAVRNCFRPTLFSKTLAVFIAVIAPIYLLNALLNLWSANSVRREQMESARMGIMLYLHGLERELSYPMREIVKLVDDQDMKLLASAQGRYEDVGYYNAGINARRLLMDIKTSSPFIAEAAVYIPAKRAMLSTASGFTDMPGEYASLKEAAHRGAYPFCTFGGTIVSAVTSDTLFKGNDEGTFLIAVTISREKILAALAEYEGAAQHRRAALISAGRGITAHGETDAEVAGALEAFASGCAAAAAESGAGSMMAGSRTYFVTWARSSALQTMLFFYTPEQSFGSILINYRYWLLAMSALIAAGVLLYSVWIKRLIIAPLDKLADAFKRLESGDFSVSLQYANDDEFGLLYKRSNEMFRRLGTLIEQVYEQKIHAREAELKQLQYQISPHFLYNSILIIGNLIKMTDYDCAGKLTGHLGNYYQYLTKGADFVPFAREAAHARDYIEIQSIRFADRFAYRFDLLPEGMAGLVVPRLILQPIIENAFKYGLGNTVSGGFLRVRPTHAGGVFTVVVEDNGTGLSDGAIQRLNDMAGGAVATEASGLVNVHRRIEIHFGRGSGLRFLRSELGGLAVEIRIDTGGGAAQYV